MPRSTGRGGGVRPTSNNYIEQRLAPFAVDFECTIVAILLLKRRKEVFSLAYLLRLWSMDECWLVLAR